MGKKYFKYTSKFLVFLVVMIVPMLSINAATKTLKTDGILIENSMLKLLDLDTSNANYGGVTNTAQELNVGDKYTIFYTDAFTYGTKKISIKIVYELISKSPNGGRNTIVVNPDGLIETWARTGAESPASRYRISYTFYNEDGTLADDNMIVFLGILAPDYGNFYFNTTNVTIYYTNGNNSTYDFDTWYEIKNDGIYRTQPDSVSANFINDEPIIAIPIRGSSFTYEYDDRTESVSGGERVVQPILYSAEFNINYVLDGGTNALNNPTTYVAGEQKDILDPTKEGYVFLGWEEGNKILSTDFGDKTFTAKWKKNTYNITTKVINGTIDSSVVVEYDNNVTINYNPNTGYVLKSIKIDENIIDIDNNKSSYTFKNVNSDHKIEVEYEIDTSKTYTIETQVINGTISEGKEVNGGDDTTVTYQPLEGYILASVTVDGVEVNIEDFKDGYEFTSVIANHTVEVVYEIDTTKIYKVETIVTNGTITEGKEVNGGDDFKVIYEPKEGYALKSIIVDGKEVDIDEFKEGYDFDSIISNHRIEVVFEEVKKSDNPQTRDNIAFVVTSLCFSLAGLVILNKKKIFNV